ncbi:SDR family NAD(P)-dependent oxidoreductase [Motilimonas cestriensis]|uniref:SDR family NAD(P)-dependent oxidoreductase n=1 Tax=Motilimonas cestriensis TaxID=2742685 RepID=UPI003DA618CE
MKTAFISGATSGIGLAFAKQLSQQGYALILHGRNQAMLQQLQQDLPHVRFTITADLSKTEQLNETIMRLEQFNAPIAVAINNAGFGLFGKHLEQNEAEIDAMLALNIAATTKLSSYFAQKMACQGGGHMLNVASTAAYQPQPYFAAYAASKAYLSSFTEALAMEMKDKNVTISCLSPGRTATRFFTFNGQDDTKNGQGTFAEKHRATPEKVAQLGLKALFKGKMRKIPFCENKFYVFLNRLLARNTILKIYQNAMEKA